MPTLCGSETMSQSAGEESDLGDIAEPTVSVGEVFHDNSKLLSTDEDILMRHGVAEEDDQHQSPTNNDHPEPAENASAVTTGVETSPIALRAEHNTPIGIAKTLTNRTLPMSPIVEIAATKSKSKMKFPPPFPGLIYGYHQNDVLSGRGATINAHPGNKRFRTVCAHRKPEFEMASNHHKRQITLEIVECVLQWKPPGRFIERVDSGANNCTALEVDEFFREVDVNSHLTGASLVYFDRMGLTFKRNKKLKRELGPWRDMGIERAIQKACGVIRDYKRPDRIALRAMGMLKRKSARDDYLAEEAHHQAMNQNPLMDGSGEEPMQDADAETTIDDDISSAYKEIVVTPSDVLLGRGAFINEHTGNRQFRVLALQRKGEFDIATPTVRKELATEIVNLTKERVPPGRFLKRAPYALQEPVLLSDGKYQLPPRGLEGPWEVVSFEKASAKAIQVMRDLKPLSDFEFRDADQVADLAGVNASMKGSSAVEVAQAVAFAIANDPMDANQDMPETSDMAEPTHDPLREVDEVENEYDAADSHQEVPEPPGMSQVCSDDLQVADDDMTNALEDGHEEITVSIARANSYPLQFHEGKVEDDAAHIDV